MVPFTVIVTVTQEVDNKMGKRRPREERDRPVNDRASVESGRLQRPRVLGDSPRPRPDPAQSRSPYVHGREGEKSELVQTDAVLNPLPSDHSAGPVSPRPPGQVGGGDPFPR